MATLSINKIAQAIHESSKGKTGSELDVLGKNAIRFLNEKHLLSKSPQILQALEHIEDTENRIVRAKISSHSKIPKKITEEITDLVKKRYNAQEVILDFRENPSLLGGIKIEVGDEVIDATLRNKINTLEAYLNN